MADDGPYLVVSRKLARAMQRDPKLATALDNIAKAAAKMLGEKMASAAKCPVCKRGTIQKDSLGACSRRYAKRKPCPGLVIA
jgi:hypothetical protein